MCFRQIEGMGGKEGGLQTYLMFISVHVLIKEWRQLEKKFTSRLSENSRQAKTNKYNKTQNSKSGVGVDSSNDF